MHALPAFDGHIMKIMNAKYPKVETWVCCCESPHVNSIYLLSSCLLIILIGLSDFSSLLSSIWHSARQDSATTTMTTTAIVMMIMMMTPTSFNAGQAKIVMLTFRVSTPLASRHAMLVRLVLWVWIWRVALCVKFHADFDSPFDSFVLFVFFHFHTYNFPFLHFHVCTLHTALLGRAGMAWCDFIAWLNYAYNLM